MYDSKYDSKMHDITIPLMGFNGFHHAGNSEFKEDFEDFIGRESILDKLKGWLEDKDEQRNKKYTGAYLITGFRGMGKSAFVHKVISELKEESKEDESSVYYVPISINVGNDLLTSKELLYIICKKLSTAFEEKTRWKHNFKSRRNIFVPQLVLTILAVFITIISLIFFKNDLTLINLFGMWMGTLLLLFGMPYIYYLIWTVTDWDLFITTSQIKRVFHRLNERIDSEMIESSEYGIDSSKNPYPREMIPGLKFLKSKKNVYRIAQTSEIQDLLVTQLQLIKRLKYAKFRFIFIIDELDKVSPVDDENQIIPEYEHSNSSSNRSTYRSRQRAFSELLANMKYFISSSEAKFIFITGYDMYEATLADISNREFNIHSIFNGYINVSSFLRKTGKSKGADSMIEEYFCHLILRPEDGDRTDLRDYAIFFHDEWKRLINDSTKVERYELLLDRRITFLRHFLTYLFYMSNGSPKKLAIYLEKYVRSRQRIEEQYELKHPDNLEEEYDDLSLGVNAYWNDCEWFLYFDVRSIQKIEFINYLIYPMIKNLIAKSSTYNDKLLVATSFMISNLYKFHKSGFSWRNLEYMPELLEINKMPELRDFIGGIMQFLNQTHIDEATGNLYMFKFPLRLSEEITFFSKTAEEVSYLFNFSHDELLSIKTLYNKQLEHYSANAGYESPAIASLHHLLGDIYMLEENYEQAIFEFNEALNAIARQEKELYADLNSSRIEKEKDSSKLLFKVRVTLKLGLAYEKRKTFDTAYIVYENLTKMLLDIANKTTPVQARQLTGNENSTIIRHLVYNTTFFSNIRISYLGILAKVAVLEKMVLGGIRRKDLWRQIQEFNLIEKNLRDEIRPVVLMDFYTKLGTILYYKNYRGDDSFVNQVRAILGLTTDTDNNKFSDCKKCSMKYEHPSGYSQKVEDYFTPCMACQYFNKSLKTCMEELGADISKYEHVSKAIYFLEQFLDSKCLINLHKKGDLFIMAMSNALLGLGNTLLGCAKVKEENIPQFFKLLYKLCDDAFEKGGTFSFSDIDEKHLSPFTKSFLYYLAAAESYKMLTDYKAAYNNYIQILDAVAVYYQYVLKDEVPQESLDFCHIITQKAIHCAYLHYDSINCAEIDTQKHELGKNYIDYINLHSLTDFPEIEVAIDKYYRILLMGNEQNRDKALKEILNSRQIGNYKLISTLTQSIQNLCMKIAVNTEVLYRIMPDAKSLFENPNFDCKQTIIKIKEYYTGNLVIDNLLKQWGWNIFNGINDPAEKRFSLLDYLLKDSLFCLNMITEFIEPLYSTTLYNNAFVGEIYRKTYIWNHLLICIREIFEYTENEDKESLYQNIETRYHLHVDGFNKDILDDCASFLNGLESWRNYCPSHISRVESIYRKVNSSSGNFMTSSYLSETAIDRFSKSIEMHTSGKAYKEMMTTLFFLEDDLQNDSNYMNLAIERFLINHGYVQDRMNQLKAHGIRKTSLLSIDNYVKQ